MTSHSIIPELKKSYQQLSFVKGNDPKLLFVNNILKTIKGISETNKLVQFVNKKSIIFSSDCRSTQNRYHFTSFPSRAHLLLPRLGQQSNPQNNKRLNSNNHHKCSQNTIVMVCTIWYHLYRLKNVANTHGGVLLLVELPATLLIRKDCFMATTDLSDTQFAVSQWLHLTKNTYFSDLRVNFINFFKRYV